MGNGHRLFEAHTAALTFPAPAQTCRVAVATAAVFLLIGGLLFLMAQQRLERHSLNAAALLASGITAIGVYAALCHSLGIVDNYTWAI